MAHVQINIKKLASAASVAAAILLLGCEAGDGGTSSAVASVSDPSVAASSPTPTPSPTAAPLAGYVPSPTLAGAPDLVASFDINQGLVPSWGTGEIPGLYGGGEGAFRLTCGAVPTLRYDDPLLYPGQAGKAHLHLFWGPANIDANTTMDTLAASVGGSTCNYGAFTVNRSAYWAPALIDDQGYARNPDWIAVYYKQPMPTNDRCKPGSAVFEGTCIGLPNRIRFIFGWDPTNPNGGSPGADWYCDSGTQHFTNLDDVFQSGCKVGDMLIANVMAPNCWDGKWLDTPNHREHMAYPGYGDWGYIKCPATHPYLIPQEEAKVAYKVTADMYAVGSDGRIHSRITLSSDHMKPGAKPGETLHSDYMEQWVGTVKRMWQENCIAKGLNCNSGDLGNGLQLTGAAQPQYDGVAAWSNPNPRSAAPMAAMKM